MKHLSTRLSLSWLAFFLLCLFSADAQVPEFAWAQRAGGPSSLYPGSFAVDGNGNSYITGTFEDSIIFGSTTLTSAGSHDLFIAKYDAAGILLWAYRAGGADNDVGIVITVDGSGNSYILGNFEYNMTFGNTTLIAGGAHPDMFIVKQDPAGNILWARRSEGTGANTGRAIAVDQNGNYFIYGIFTGTSTFGNIALTSSGDSDVFIVKYDSAGNVLWAKQAGGASSDSGLSMVVDDSGNCYISGFFRDSAAFGNATLTSSGLTDIFTAKYDSAGNVLWAKRAGGAGYDLGHAVRVDASGNTYITGTFQGSSTFGSTTFISSGLTDLFLVKYDAAGNLLWARQAGGAGEDAGHGITLDNSGNSYITGYFENSIDFGSTTLTSSGLTDLFIAKYDAAGNAIWAKRAGGTGFDTGFLIDKDASGNFYLTGLFSSNVTFGTTTLTNTGPDDIFIARLDFLTGASANMAAGSLAVYPNPFATDLSFSLPAGVSGPVTLILTDMLGREVHRQVVMAEAENSQITLTPPSGISTGLYLLRVQQGEVVRQVRVVKE